MPGTVRAAIASVFILATALAPLLLSSCQWQQRRRYVVGVSQCSEDTWRDKLNEELRVAALYYDVDLRIKSASDDVRLQTEQINRFVDEGVDLLVVAPGQVSISPAIDRAYERGIPVIVFDRRTRSDKYTAYIGADNRSIGAAMAEYIASTPGKTRVLELCGLSSSSPAIERGGGFDSVAARRPDMEVVQRLHADWTEQGAYRATDSLLSCAHAPFNCIFAHNDRMAMGARRAVVKHGIDPSAVMMCGIDAMPQEGGGMQLVDQGLLFASYTYPTRGDEVMQLAMNILHHRPYKRENRLQSALVTRDNARVLLMQNDETARQQSRLVQLSSRVDKTVADFDTQRGYLLLLLCVVVLLCVACAYAVRAYYTKAQMNRRLKDSVERQRQMTEHIEQLTQTQLQFFTNISHELRTPLTLIAGPTEQLLADTTLKQAHRRMLQMVERNTKILTQLVGEILEFRKVQNNKATLRLRRFALGDALAAWAGDFAAMARQKGIAMHTVMSADARAAVVVADRDKLARVFFNLMSNAMKYTPRGGTVTLSLTHLDGRFVMSVNNTGTTIDAGELPHLFERFYQARGSIGGTGIGLALVKAYIDMHRGTVAATSTDSEGTTFCVTLPDSQPGYDPATDDDANGNGDGNGDMPRDLALADDSYTPTDAKAAGHADRITATADFDDDRPLILVIDDNSGMRTYLRSLLQESYNVSEAADGQEGLECARREVPKLVVCDVMMPGMDGLEFTRRLKADTATSHIPVILLTARSLAEQREEGYGTGADSYLTKPFSGAVLLSRIDNLLRSRTLLRSLFGGGKGEAEAESRLGTQDQTFVARLRNIIQSHIADTDFSVERIGEEIGLSRVQLYRKVKALTGLSPVELMRKARLQRARQLIERTDKSMAEIAYEVGFTSPSYFNKCFKDEYGTSPGTLRNDA